jgi:hypothetical protein
LTFAHRAFAAALALLALAARRASVTVAPPLAPIVAMYLRTWGLIGVS